MPRILFLLSLASGLLLTAYVHAGQSPLPNLRQMAQHSAYIFSGRVMAVHQQLPQQNGSAGTVEITFRVEESVRGVRVGDLLTIREWAGLWGTKERYRRGQRLLLFLYPPSRLGLTSPVGGSAGRFALDAQGAMALPAARALLGTAFVPSPAQKQRIPVRDVAATLRRMVQEQP
ncbi:MAG: hypothetical protein JST79_08610 [Acidobacteria bacterium]|nr:hypothetical protein [Acidobacteriota bacterium]